jgi:hypothetical protein
MLLIRIDPFHPCSPAANSWPTLASQKTGRTNQMRPAVRGKDTGLFAKLEQQVWSFGRYSTFVEIFARLFLKAEGSGFVLGDIDEHPKKSRRHRLALRVGHKAESTATAERAM